MSKEKYEWYKCCVEEIRRLWKTGGGSMNIVWYSNKCPNCGHYIGLTQTNEKDAIDFLKEYNLTYSVD